MSAYKTYGDVLDYVQNTLDLKEENFITGDELLTYCEEAIKQCEAEVHKLNIEDQYFVSVAPIALSAGKAEYSLPSNIFGNKLLRVVVQDGATIFEIPRIRVKNRFTSSARLDQYPTADIEGYMLVNNDARSGTKIRMFSKSQRTSNVVTLASSATTISSTLLTVSSTAGLTEGYFVSGTGIANGTRVQSVDSATTLTLTSEALATGSVTLTFTEPKCVSWYIRAASIPTTTTDYIDFPEFWNFIAQHMICQCLAKEIGNQRIKREEAKLEQIREQVFSTLADMVPDQDDTIEKDVTAYEDMDVAQGVYT
jgi:hypothetical protein